MNSSIGCLAKSPEYQSFRSTIAQRKVAIDNKSENWVIYDAGPRSVRSPLIFLPPASGSADVFFKQIVFLSSVGYRVISVEYPSYWTHAEWTEGFKKLLDTLQLDKVHLFGASLGGFLAQKVAESTHINPRIHSIILCNSFSDTSVFTHNAIASTFWLMPSFLLKRIILEGFNDDIVDKDVADSVDFMVERVEGLKRSQLASRLKLNCSDSYVEPQKLSDVIITIIDVFDESALSQNVKEEMYKCYPNSRRAHLKDGGNFPYLSRSVEVNLYIQIHMRQFIGSRCSAVAPEFERDLDNVQTELENQLRENSNSSSNG
ncbi:uncharacterized protein TRIADDRAFT_22848 [Trichoplax adhaerens]|uniref:Maspardin n=1 Tax=Trichoplax adhaerens TaxID=10228 RepID=B3RRR2_TRIAD|nr:hypothetical protein TRIADDRAFT_22848 [Trichoplax adhaerens]EDV26915.1 hypothetical protein TRIADDRAFT_22848 [Trichoplax adhaerens]|eukprot:XP_002110911.1 hypothetical protein TRIADDRAFT_22848 [Trichoplax adhaerens]